MRLRMLLTVCAVTVLATTSHAAVPASITVQGRVTDASNNPLPAGAKSFVFRIFNASVGGTEIWPGGAGEMQTITTSSDGLWIGLVGAISPLTDVVFTDTLRWLQITVTGTTLPRIRLVTGPFAYRVATVDGATGGTITSRVSIGTGHTNTGLNSFVAGASNAAIGTYSSVTGGEMNGASGQSSHIGAGAYNICNGNYAVIAGGLYNTAPGENASVGGGWTNHAQGNFSVVSGGVTNTASAEYTTVSGGQNNIATLSEATVGGGRDNVASGFASTISGGRQNIASGTEATVGGGQRNMATGDATVGGGEDNVASAHHATVAGGWQDTASGIYSAVAGGRRNFARGDYSAIAGGGGAGAGDSNSASGSASSIGGGFGNRASAQGSAVSGGGYCSAEGEWSNVGGGFDSHATNARATVAGGQWNVASGNASSVAGGQANSATAQYAAVGGGNSNAASGDYSTVPGGYNNAASGLRSFAAGSLARARHSSSFVWGDQITDSFVSTAAQQFLIHAVGGVGVGTNVPEAPLHILETPVTTVTAHPNSSAVFERNGSNYVTILGSEDRGILIGGPGDMSIAGVTYNAGLMTFSNDGPRMNLDNSGNLNVGGCVDATNTSCASDERLKKDVVALGDGVETIERLRGVKFRWRRDEFPDRRFDEGEQIGLIAQEVKIVVPSAVRERSDGYLSVEYNSLVPLLIEAIKEQQKRIEALEKKLERQTP